MNDPEASAGIRCYFGNDGNFGNVRIHVFLFNIFEVERRVS